MANDNSDSGRESRRTQRRSVVYEDGGQKIRKTRVNLSGGALIRWTAAGDDEPITNRVTIGLSD